jgi:GDSL-like Lipase/Acylhydrolase family
MRKSIIRSTASVVAGFAVAIVLAECILRLFQLAPSVSVVTVTDTDFERIPGIFSPEQDLVERSIRQLPYHVVIDSLGYRGVEFTRQKPSGETRVLMIGDSFTFGEFVSEGETLPAILEAQLQKQCPSLRVINAGLPGSTITDQHEMLRRGMTLAPDAVVLVMTTNDIPDLMAETMWPRLAANRAAKSRFPLSLVYPVLRHTAVFNLLQRVRAVMFNRATGAAAPELPDSVRMRPAKLRYDRELLAIRDTLSALQIPFVFVLVPDHRLVNGDHYNPMIDWESATARTAGIDALDMLPVFRSSGLPVTKLYLLPWDGHTSPAGNAVAADALQRKLSEDGLPPCQSMAQVAMRAAPFQR